MRVFSDSQRIQKYYIQHPIQAFAFTYMVVASCAFIYKHPPGILKNTPHESVILT